MYKLVAIDLDDTLLQADKTIAQKDLEAIHKIQSYGIHVVLATGRPIAGIKKYFSELHFSPKDFIVCFNGAKVMTIDEKTIISKNTLKGRDLHALYALSKELKVNIHAHNDQGCLTPVMSKYTKLEVEVNNIFFRITDFSDINPDEEIIKVMYVDEPEYLDSIIPKLPEWVYEKYNVVKSAPFFLEMLNKRADKWYGISDLAEYLHIKPEEIMCFGDSENDALMIKNSGMGISMENGIEIAKKDANFITKSNRENGVAFALKKFIINKL